MVAKEGCEDSKATQTCSTPALEVETAGRSQTDAVESSPQPSAGGRWQGC